MFARRLLRGRALAIALPAAIVTVGVSVVAVAAIPGTDGKISGCYEKNLGILRVIDAQAGKTCTRFETPISWNQTGPKGDAGATGAAGATGNDGAPGAKGETGAAGNDGAPGAKGETGAAGNDGAPGAKGETGAAGNDGAPGAKGDKGDTGAAGADGAPGAKGDKGDTGATGAQGATGAAGATNVTVKTGIGTVSCNSGQKATGGGGEAIGPAAPPATGPATLVRTGPLQSTGTPTGWVAFANGPSGGFTAAPVYVVCAAP